MPFPGQPMPPGMMPPQGMPPSPMAPPGAGMMPPMGPVPMDGLMSQIAGLMQSMPKTSMEKVRDAVKLLTEARDDDPKIGENLSMAIGLIKHGPECLDKYDSGSYSTNQSSSRKNSEESKD